MQIDWLTATAQIVNFLVLVWLLKRFLYRPVVDAMARREERIAAQIADAAAREDEAAAAAEGYRAKAAALDEQREETMSKARTAAEREKRRLLEEARSEVEEQREKWRKAIAHEHEELRKTVEREIVDSAAAIARRALADLADTTLETQVVASFLRRLEGVSPDERALFASAEERVRIASSFELAPTMRERLRKALGLPDRIDYVRDAELVCGIAVSSRSHKLEWNVADYLGGFLERFEALLVPPAGHGVPG